MPPDLPLIFQGIRWPSARIVKSEPMVFRTYPRDQEYQPPSRTIFTFTAGRSGGRQWTSKGPQAFWRDFSKIDLNDAEAVTTFIRRRGDPQGLLDDVGETNTGYWNNFAAVLHQAAQAWDPEDSDGVSRVNPDPQRLGRAKYFLLESNLGVPALKDLEAAPDPDGWGIVLRARTLATFMVASAASAVVRRIPMRRCRHCQSWFEMTRTDVRFCSPSCRATHHKTEKEISHGKHQEKAGQERPDNMAKPVARAGKERAKPPANKKPRKRQGSPRTRVQDGAGGRAPRRR